MGAAGELLHCDGEAICLRKRGVHRGELFIREIFKINGILRWARFPGIREITIYT